MDIKIIYEDDSLLVIDKPSGITVDRSETTKEETIQDWTESKLRIKSEKLKVTDNEFLNRAGIVHRLDKETSGILLIAKTAEVFSNLQSQFKERKVKKTYIALVHGKVAPSDGEISVPVGRLSFNRKRFGVVAGGREAITQYKALSTKYLKSNPLSLVELYPKTGRTHQIRVHLKYFGHPVFADALYAGRKTARADRKLLPRLFLHASEIKFIHPITRKSVSFTSPLPKNLNNFLSII
jgi:23S rRNA pseudouridine1911/1915/1917 synthase